MTAAVAVCLGLQHLFLSVTISEEGWGRVGWGGGVRGGVVGDGVGKWASYLSIIVFLCVFTYLHRCEWSRC